MVLFCYTVTQWHFKLSTSACFYTQTTAQQGKQKDFQLLCASLYDQSDTEENHSPVSCRVEQCGTPPRSLAWECDTPWSAWLFLKTGRSVCVCACLDGKEWKRTVAPLAWLRYPGSMFKRRGWESSLFLPRRGEKPRHSRKRSTGGCRFSASCITYKPQEELARLSQDQTPYTNQHILCVSSSPPTDLLQGNPLT